MPNASFEEMLLALRQSYAFLPEWVGLEYTRRYGTRAYDLLGDSRSLADLGLHFGGTLYEREARFLKNEEWAQTAEDILERRTKHGLHLTATEKAMFSAWFSDLVQGDSAQGS